MLLQTTRGSDSFTCPDWKGAKSAYHFFDNERFDENAILLPHIEATQKRVSSIAEKVLVLHDTTEFNYSHLNRVEGPGYLSTFRKDTIKKRLSLKDSLCMRPLL